MKFEHIKLINDCLVICGKLRLSYLIRLEQNSPVGTSQQYISVTANPTSRLIELIGWQTVPDG